MGDVIRFPIERRDVPIPLHVPKAHAQEREKGTTPRTCFACCHALMGEHTFCQEFQQYIESELASAAECDSYLVITGEDR